MNRGEPRTGAGSDPGPRREDDGLQLRLDTAAGMYEDRSKSKEFPRQLLGSITYRSELIDK